jgi:iron complex transport system permease protein
MTRSGEHETDDTDGTDDTGSTATAGARGALLALGIGVAAAVLGLLPGILSDLRMPPPALWRSQTVAADAPLALLPLSTSTAALLAAVLVVGGGLAGAAARVLRPRLPRHGTWLVVAGVLVVQVVALVQAAVATTAGLRTGSASAADGRAGTRSSEEHVYLVVIVAGTAGLIALAALVAAVVARAPAGVAVAAWAFAAVLLGAWVTGFLPPAAPAIEVRMDVLPDPELWLPPVALGIAIALTGLRSAGRVVGSVVAVGLLWLGSGLVVAADQLLSNRLLLIDPRETVGMAGTVVGGVLGGQGGTFERLAVAVVVGVVGAAVVRAIRRRAVSAVGAG